MKGGLPPLLLAVFTVLVRCQPQVKLTTTSNPSFTGDLVYLRCDNATNENTVKWYFNNTTLGHTGKHLKIPVASSSDSGSYQCESNREKSEAFAMDVSDFSPSASLTIHSGQPVMPRGSSVNLMINNEDGLEGWLCWSYKGNKMYRIILKKVQSQSHVFETRLNLPETIIWCTSKTKDVRSNQISLRTSDKDVLLEMYPHPAVAGESLTLRCMVWGTDQISHTVFYMNDEVIEQGYKSTYEIPAVTDTTKGNYKCNAVYTHVARTSGPPRNVTSDSQEVFVTEHPITAVLQDDMTCSCSSCTSSASYRYYKKTDQSWIYYGSKMPGEGGTYRCRAVWSNMRSYPSASVEFNGSGSNKNTIINIILVVLILAVVVGVAVFCYIHQKKRQTSGAIYEDVGLKARDKDEDKYQELKGGRGREAEYDTLKPEAAGKERKEGEYEPLKKDETKEGVYHTLGMEGAAGGDGGYEALKKGETKEGVYHTLGKEAAEGGDGGYEALKKGETKAEVYHTLRKEGAEGGDGGYEALKKAGMKDEVYHTLGKDGAEGGDGGYEALKKAGMKDEVYHTLGKEGAEGGKEEVGKKDKESEVVEQRKEEI